MDYPIIINCCLRGDWFYLDKMPETMVINWGPDGPDVWSSSFWGLMFSPVIGDYYSFMYIYY